MLFRLRQTDGSIYCSGNWISPDGKSEQIASADITMTPMALTEIADRKMPTAWRIDIASRGLDIESTPLNRKELDGHELSLLGRTDQLSRAAMPASDISK